MSWNAQDVIEPSIAWTDPVAGNIEGYVVPVTFARGAWLPYTQGEETVTGFTLGTVIAD